MNQVEEEYNMQGVFNNISIQGIQAVVPTSVVENIKYSDLLGERRCKKQIRLTGVKQRHVCKPGQTAADLAYVAGKKILEEINWEPESIDVLLFATQNPLFALPSTAFLLQKRLGIGKDCVVFDLNLGCSSATVGIQVASSLLQQGRPEARALLLIADPDYESTETDPEVLADQLLFGAAGAAIALQKTESPLSPLYFQNKSDGNRYKTIMRQIGGLCQMDGVAVFEFGVNDVAADILSFHKDLGITTDDVDFYVFHQAQALMLSTIDDICKIASEKELRSLDYYGNTNGCSIPVTLCVHEKTFKTKDAYSLFLCGFGVGLSWCSLYTNVNGSCVYPLIFTDDIYSIENE